MSSRNSSNYYYNSSPILGTSHQIIWKGGNIDCLGICDGVRLTELETAIANKVCELAANTDVSNVVLPACLISAWGTRDKTVLEFIKFLLDEDCLIKQSVDSLADDLANYNPLITVNYPPCCENVCLVGETYTISQHFEKVLGCLCDLSSQVATLTQSNTTLTNTVTSLLNTVNSLQTTVNTINTKVINLQIQVDACCG